MKVNKLEVIADRGYFSGDELLACNEDGITAIVPKPDTSGNRKKDGFVKADFICDAKSDVYICTAGQALSYRYSRDEHGQIQRLYWQNECQNCSLKARCTIGKERRIARWEHEHLIEAIYARMDESPGLMRTRRCTVEHPFEAIIAWMGFTHFLTRRFPYPSLLVELVRAYCDTDIVLHVLKIMCGVETFAIRI